MRVWVSNFFTLARDGVLLRRRALGLLLCLGFLLFSPELFGQELEVTAPRTVNVGRPFEVSFTSKSKTENFKAPDWGAIRVVGGPSIGRSSGIEVHNGKVTQYSTYSYTYLCQIDSEGDYTIPSASADIDGKQKQSEPFEIRAVGGGASGGQTTPPASQPRQQTQDKQATGKDLQLRTQLSRHEVYQGEPILATLKLYTRIDVVSFDDLKFPDFKGFWAKDIDMPRQISFTTEVLNGLEYNAGILRQYLLYPQKTGSLTIDPAEAVLQYRVRGTPRSIFEEFMGTFRTAMISVKGAPQTVKVKPLPEGKPQPFSGGVGQFQVKSTLDHEAVKTNEALTYRITVSGTGNFHMLAQPELQLPATLEAYEPKVIDNYSVKGSNQQGKITYEYIIIPRAPGQVEIPAYRFSYFDPKQRAYKTLTTEKFSIDVEADPNATTSMVTAGISKEEVQALGEDIRYIHTTPQPLLALGASFTTSVVYWVFIVGFILLFIAAYFILRYQQRMLADRRLARSKKARQVVRRRLRRAKMYLDQEDDQFFQELLRALWGFLSDKLHMDTSALSSDRVAAELKARGVPEQLVQQLDAVIAECEYAQYAPAASRDKNTSLYDSAFAAVSDLDDWLKRAPRRGKEEKQ